MNVITNKIRFNKGTKSGRNILKESLRVLGCGRSILCDKNGVVISGNNVLEAAQELGYAVRVIEAQPNELIVLKRSDVDATEKKGLELAFVDNLVSEKGLKWNADLLLEEMNHVLNFDPRVWHGHSALVKDLRIEDFLKEGTELVPQKTEKHVDLSNVEQLSLFDLLNMETSDEESDNEESDNEESPEEESNKEEQAEVELADNKEIEKPEESTTLGIDDDF